MSRVRPILFNTEMVQDILEDYKAATRRLIRPRYQKHETGFEIEGNKHTGQRWVCMVDDEGHVRREITPPYLPNDIMYVRETWAFIPCIDCMDYGCSEKIPVTHEDRDTVSEGCYIYRAGHEEPERITWRPSIHMPRAAARIWLKVKDVRIEHLQDMTLDDFLKEGVVISPEAFNDPSNAYMQARNKFIEIWDSTLPRGQQDLYGWEANPLVWTIEFEWCRKPESEE